MPKTKISEYSTTNSQNTDIQSINIDEGCAPSGINNAIRELMVHLRNFQTNASGDGATLASLVVQGTGSFTGGVTLSGGATLSGTNTLSGSNIMSGNINSSGTNTFSGSQVISGNINSSGTTNTFSGGNILSGTNTLSGSTIISGNFNATGTTNTFSNALILGNNLTFTGTGNRITGDFSNATLANRVLFQTSTSNGNTIVQAITNGTGNTARFNLSNSSDPANASEASFGITNTELVINSTLRGTGSYLPIRFDTGGSERMRIDTSGNVGIGTSSPANALDVRRTSGESVIGITNAGTGSSWVTFTPGSSGAAYLHNTGNTPMIFTTNGSERMRIDSSGNVGIGTSSPAARLEVAKASGASDIRLSVAGTLYGNIYASASDFTINSVTAIPITFGTNSTERMRIDSSGNVGIGTSSPSTQLEVYNAATAVARVTSGTEIFEIRNTGSEVRLAVVSADPMTFRTSNVEAMRITSGGAFLVGTTTVGTTNTGSGITLSTFASFQNAGSTPVFVNRNTDDGTLIEFRQADATEGSISVSGNTVSYNAFAGSHWSQLSDGSKPEILRGTVMESINELVEWPGEPTSERLCRVKISDTDGSKKVYGVFMCWDEDWTATNDMLVTSVGAFICRVNGSVMVQEGDLLESNGDGTARVQTDDIIRSSTIGKVTCTTKTYEYADGSYCVPTVLYCG